MQIIEIAKQHPVPVSIGVIVVLLVIMTRNSSSGSSSAAGYNSAAAIQSSTNLATINMQGSVQLGAQATERYKAGQDAATQRSGIAASVFTSLATINANAQTAQSGLSMQTVKNAIDGANARYTVESNANVQLAKLKSDQETAANNLAGQIQMNLADNNTKLSAIGLQTQGNLDAIKAQGDVTLAQLGMNISNYQTTLPQLLQSTQEIARINGANAIQIVKEQQAAANKKAQAEKNKSDWGIVGDIAGSIGSFFGF